MAEMEMTDYVDNGDQNYGNEQCVPAPQPVEAQPVGNIPTSVLNAQPGQPSPGYQQQFLPQQENAPPPGNASHAQPPPGYAPQTQPPPGYAPHTQPPPGYAPQTQPPPGYAQHGYFSQSGLHNNKATDTGSTCWLVVGILTAIFLCPPLGIAGAVMAYLSGEEARRGNAAAHKTKICQSKALTLTGLGIGLLAIIAVVTVVGYKYAGLQDEYLCYCGSSYGSYSELDQSKCNSVCPADNKECGGYYINSVYRTNYLGCFADSSSPSALGDSSHYLDYYDASPQTCTSRCGEDGYEFAGLSGRDCYCGNDPNRYGESFRQYCDEGCDYNSDLACGGDNFNSVFKTDANKDQKYHYLGCYLDSLWTNELPVLTYFWDNNPSQCASTCSNKDMLDYNQGLSVTVASLTDYMVNRIFVT
ncbi:LIPI [Bugula neritina]|uniref:LIPI n=1 Tax=Bugula neritina TaxID=10212 RepID=A0A7J7K2I0_BUGNE|nr:LIPI [Bugula neritina]